MKRENGILERVVRQREAERQRPVRTGELVQMRMAPAGALAVSVDPLG